MPIWKKEARGFKRKAFRFILIDGVLFKKSVAGTYLRCLDKDEAQQVIKSM